MTRGGPKRAGVLVAGAAVMAGLIGAGCGSGDTGGVIKGTPTGVTTTTTGAPTTATSSVPAYGGSG